MPVFRKTGRITCWISTCLWVIWTRLRGIRLRWLSVSRFIGWSSLLLGVVMWSSFMGLLRVIVPTLRKSRVIIWSMRSWTSCEMRVSGTSSAWSRTTWSHLSPRSWKTHSKTKSAIRSRSSKSNCTWLGSNKHAPAFSRPTSTNYWQEKAN